MLGDLVIFILEGILFILPRLAFVIILAVGAAVALASLVGLVRFVWPIAYRRQPGQMPYSMVENDTVMIEIPLSRKRMILILLIGLGFAATLTGISIVSIDGIKTHKNISDILACIVFLCLACPFVIFMGSLAIWAAIRLFSPTGILIVPDGFYDYSTLLRKGFVAWEDVAGFAVWELSGQPYLNVDLYDPEMYIARQSNPLRRFFGALGFHINGSYISIPLKHFSDPDTTEYIMREQYENYLERESFFSGYDQANETSSNKYLVAADGTKADELEKDIESP